MSDRHADTAPAPNFIRSIIEEDIASGRYDGRVVTRFPPEPNGYLHIGHAKSICLNFGLARDFGGTCHLRFDDTNPETEDPEYVESIMSDVRWLGFDWGDHLYFASDYFDKLYECAELLIERGKAYVDSQDDDEIRRTRGTVTEAGVESPYRERPVAENLDLFRRMRAGEFGNGEHVLRAKIDMTSPNMKMRDPLLYRIRHARHYRTGHEWCIYPMYDFAHPLSDAIENITHSICTLEFENNRELYDWVLDNTWTTPRPHQYEFNRLNLDFTVMSKRKLLELVGKGDVSGWDDPRLPTLAGLRRRGVTSGSIRDFCDRVGVVRSDSRVDFALLEHSIRNDLNFRAPRVMAVLDPLRVVITNYPDDRTDWLDAPYWPHDVPKEGSRKVPFSKVLYIDREDFREDPPPKYHRLAPGREVRLRYAFLITCDEIIKDPHTGAVIEVRCSHDPSTRGGDAPDGRKVRGTLHWVDAEHSLPAEFRLYDRLFFSPDPEGSGKDWKSHINPESAVRSGGRVEPSVLEDAPDTRYQFERVGYFWRDPVDSSESNLVFNRIVTLRDTWAKIAAATKPESAAQSKPGSSKQTSPAASKPAKMAASKQTASAASKPRKSAGETAAPVTENRSSPTPGPGPTLSAAQRKRAEAFTARHGLDRADAGLIVSRDELSEFFEAAVLEHDNPGAIANWIIHELLRELKDGSLPEIGVTPADLAELVMLVDDGAISGRTAKDVFARMIESGGSPRSIVEKENLGQMSDRSTLEPLVDSIVHRYPDKVDEYRGGKRGLIGFFVGQVMRKTDGRANPEMVKNLLESRLG